MTPAGGIVDEAGNVAGHYETGNCWRHIAGASSVVEFTGDVVSTSGMAGGWRAIIRLMVMLSVISSACGVSRVSIKL